MPIFSIFRSTFRFLFCGAAMLGAATTVLADNPTPIRSFTYDLNAVGLAETVNVFAPADPTVSTNAIVQVLANGGGNLFALPPSTGSGSPNSLFDRFGFVVRGISGLSGSSSRQLVISSPIRPGVASTNYLVPSGLGCVTIYSGDGTWQQTISAPVGARLGLDIADVADQDMDGSRELLIAGALVQPGTSQWMPRTFVYSGRTGALLAIREQPIAVLQQYAATRAIYLPGDLDDTGSIDTLDLTAMLGMLGMSGASHPEADLNHDGTIDALDMQMQINGYLAGRRSIKAAIVDVDPHLWTQFVADWANVYTGQLTVTIPSDPGNSGGGNGGNGGNGGGDELDNFTGNGGFFNTATLCNCGGGPVTNPDQRACTVGIQCPDVLHVGDSFAGQGSSRGDSCTWSIIGPPFVLTQDRPGNFTAIGIGMVKLRLECTDENGCCACAECTVFVNPIVPPHQCMTTVEILCSQNGAATVSAGGRYRIGAKAFPPGGHFTWSVVPSAPDAIVVEQTVLVNWPTAVVAFGQPPAPPADASDWQTHPRSVRVGVMYEIDGCPPAYAECNYTLDVVDPHLDSDGDGWPDSCETALGSDPHDYHSIPAQAYWDTDKDGLSDAEEICIHGTDPYRYDSDGSGVSDYAKVKLGLSTASPPTTGLSNAQWLLFQPLQDVCGGWVAPLHSVDPAPLPGGSLNSAIFKANDKDGDLLIDSYERQHGLDPLNPDTDGDGIPDGIELLAGRDPLVFDTVPLLDTDGDGLPDLVEIYITHTDPFNPDTDGDGLPDGWEVKYGLDPNDPDTGHTGVRDGDKDMDGDGLSNLQEYLHATNPRNVDSDGDGTTDLQEILQGSNPADASDRGLPSCGQEWCDIIVDVSVDLNGLGVEATAKIGGFSVSAGFAPGTAYVEQVARVPAGVCLPVSMNIKRGAWSSDNPNTTTGCGYYSAIMYIYDGGDRVGETRNCFALAPLTSRKRVVQHGWYDEMLIAPEPYWQYWSIHHPSFIQTDPWSNWPCWFAQWENYSKQDGGKLIVVSGRIVVQDDATSPSGKRAVVRLLPDFINQEHLTITWYSHGLLSTGDAFSVPLPADWELWGVACNVTVTAEADPPYFRLRSRPDLVMTDWNSTYAGPDIGSGNIFLKPVGINVMIDSTNTLGFGRSYGEGVSVAQQAPGKLVPVNYGDLDADGVPNWADGFKFHASDIGVSTPPPPAGAIDRVLDPGTQLFVPVVVRYNTNSQLPNAMVRFDYAASDPTGVTMHLPSPDDDMDSLKFFLPGDADVGPIPNERFRLWTVSGDRVRDPRSVVAGGSPVVAGGNFIPKNVNIPLSQLDSSGVGEFVLFLEAVRPSLQSGENIGVHLLDSSGNELGSDTVKVTALGTRFVKVSRDASDATTYTPVDKAPMSTPAPVIGLQWEIQNPRFDAAKKKILGDIVITSQVHDFASDLIQGQEGIIATAHVAVNGELQRQSPDGPALDIPVSLVSKATTRGTDPSRPFPFEGAVNGYTLYGVELQPGWNEVQLFATNHYGFTGFVESGREVVLTLPPDDELTVEVVIPTADPYYGTPLDGATGTLHVHHLLRMQDGGVVSGSEFDKNYTLEWEHKSGGWGTDGVHLRFETENGDGWNATLFLQALGLNDEPISITRPTAPDTTWRGGRAISGADRTDYTGSLLSLGGATTSPLAYDGSQNSGFMIEMVGPPGLVLPGSTASILGHENFGFTTFQIDGQNRLFLTDLPVLSLPDPLQRTPTVFVMSPSLEHPLDWNADADGSLYNEFKARKMGGAWYIAGVGVGLWQGGVVSLWDGAVAIYDTGVTVTAFAIEHSQLGILYRITVVGDARVVMEDEQKFWKDKAAAAQTMARYLLAIQRNQPGVIAAILTGDMEGLDADQREVAKTAQTVYQAILSQAQDAWNGMDDYEHGKVLGNILGQAIQALAIEVGTLGLGTEVVLATKAKILAKIAEAIESSPKLTRVQEALGAAKGAVVAKIVEAAQKLSQTHMCFVAGTLVSTSSGLVPIEQVKPGDMVLARREQESEARYCPVVNTILTHPAELWTVAWAGDGGGADSATGTAVHPFWVGDRHAWVPMGELKLGDELTLIDNGCARVIEVHRLSGLSAAGTVGGFTTYNLEVQDAHTYFVGSSGVWVHNVGVESCQELFELVTRIQEQDGSTLRQAFEKVMKLSNEKLYAPGAAEADPVKYRNALRHREKYDVHWATAAREVTVDAYTRGATAGADWVRETPTAEQLYQAAGYEFSPLYPGGPTVWHDSLTGTSALQVHHTGGQNVAKSLFRRVHPDIYASFTADADWAPLMNDMPGMLINVKDGRIGAGPTHAALESKIQLIDLSSTRPISSIFADMADAYAQWDPDLGPKIWTVARKWYESKGILP